jgi:hypothetical protein
MYEKPIKMIVKRSISQILECLLLQVDIVAPPMVHWLGVFATNVN